MEKVTCTFSLSKKAKKLLRQLAKAENRKMSNYLEMLILREAGQ